MMGLITLGSLKIKRGTVGAALVRMAKTVIWVGYEKITH